MKIRSVIFDLDGTLVHTRPEYRYLVVGKTLDKLNISADRKAIDQFWFNADRDNLIRKLFNTEPEKFWNVFKEFDQTELRKKFTEKYNDSDVIKQLKSENLKIGIVTGTTQEIADMEIELLGKNLIDAVIIAQLSRGVKQKPHPQGIEECLRELSVTNNEAIFVGNSDEDILTAKNAGVVDVLIDRKEHALKIKPSFIINSLFEIKEIINKIQ